MSLRRIAMLLGLLSVLAQAQSAKRDVSVELQPGLVSLADGWRTRAGDNLEWARADYDDSGWQSTKLTASSLPAGQRWYRLRVHLPEGRAPLALLIVAPGDSFEVWNDGKRIFGSVSDSWLPIWADREFVVPLPAQGGETEIALRVSLPRYIADTYRGDMSVYVGGVAAAEAEAAAGHDRRVLFYLPSALFNLAMAIAGLAALLLFFGQRSRPEYLWMGLYFIVQGVSTALWQAANAGLLPYWPNSLIGDPLSYLALASQIEFSFAFIGRRVSRGWRVCESALLGAIFLAFLSCAGAFPATPYWLVEAAESFVVGVGLPILLLVHYRRGNREAGLLILPILLPGVSLAVNDIGTAGSALGYNRIVFLSNYTFFVGRVQILAIDLANIGFLLAIGALLHFRFTRVTHQQAHAAAELEAAQRVQSLLLRRAHPDTALANMEVIYCPAQEVGGDFFHTAYLDGSTRIVVGDVSGKGMGAAMLVSVLVGALDSIPETRPEAVLDRLNSILLVRQEGGFATCVCALIGPDGSLTVANAGHLAPYRSGEEMEVGGGLPLGISSEAEYCGTSMVLAAGDQLTFLSDGVVEAQTQEGELFGFERTRAISTQSAEEIVRAAQRFGQQDDITVLTLEFAGAEVVTHPRAGSRAGVHSS